MEGISVVINTYNAEKHLARALDSVSGFDEVVICDMESTDATVEIAHSRGCRVVTFPKGDCVSAEPAWITLRMSMGNMPIPPYFMMPTPSFC